ncbi:MAG TPA: alpha-ribazole phosphatase [Candidatus Omnitrophica bacterium]|nr:alpha-ribazole phosphatase [Candidatus Omnitrophota bacterium]
MKLYLIRHGQTSFNVLKKYMGHTDCPLNKEGCRQAKQMALHLQKQNFHKIYVSDLKRAVNFAKIIFQDTPLCEARQLREINFGSLEGLTHTQITKRHPDFYPSWLRSPHNIKFPDGESLLDLKKRVTKFIEQVYHKNQKKTVGVVTHAGPIKVILEDILRSKNFWDIGIDNASLTIVGYKGRKKDLKLLNDTSFL